MTSSNTKLPAQVCGTGSLLRPLFAAGQLLQEDDLTQIVEYMRSQSRLMFRCLFGCGVMCGFDVTSRLDGSGNLRVDVTPGVAIGGQGDPIEMPDAQTIVYDPALNPIPAEMWLWISISDRSCAPRDTLTSDTTGVAGQSANSRARNAYKLTLGASCPSGLCACGEAAVQVAAPPDDRAAVAPATNANDSQANQSAILASASDPCYEAHYNGSSEDCNGDSVLLAKLTFDQKGGPKIDYSVRRFVRPALIREPHSK